MYKHSKNLKIAALCGGVLFASTANAFIVGWGAYTDAASVVADGHSGEMLYYGAANMTFTMNADLSLYKIRPFPGGDGNNTLTFRFDDQNRTLNVAYMDNEPDDKSGDPNPNVGNFTYSFEGDNGTVNFYNGMNIPSLKTKDGSAIAEQVWNFGSFYGDVTSGKGVVVRDKTDLIFNNFNFSSGSRSISVTNGSFTAMNVKTVGKLGDITVVDGNVDIKSTDTSSNGTSFDGSVITASGNSIVNIELNKKPTDSYEQFGAVVNASGTSQVTLTAASWTYGSKFTVDDGATLTFNNVNAFKTEISRSNFKDGSTVTVNARNVWFYGKDTHEWGSATGTKVATVNVNSTEEMKVIGDATLIINKNVDANIKSAIGLYQASKLVLNGNNVINKDGGSQKDNLELKFYGKDASLVLGAANDIYSIAFDNDAAATIKLNGNKFSFQCLYELAGSILYFDEFEDGLVTYEMFGDLDLSKNEDGSLKYIKGIVGGNVIDLMAISNVAGTYDIVSAVPEPSTYAAIFGVLALAFVAYRRRK